MDGGHDRICGLVGWFLAGEGGVKLGPVPSFTAGAGGITGRIAPGLDLGAEGAQREAQVLGRLLGRQPPLYLCDRESGHGVDSGGSGRGIQWVAYPCHDMFENRPPSGAGIERPVLA
jgi:hypothetical protein